MKHASIISVLGTLILVSGAFWLGMSGDYDITNYPSSGETIIAFGDSLVRGTGSTEGNDFVALLSRRINVPIENLGYPGDTTAMALLHIDDVRSMDPKVVLVLLGGNDFLRRVPKSETLKNLERIITTIQGTGAVVILLGVRGGIITDGYESDLRTLAKKTGSAYVPNVLKGLLGNNEYMSDSIHPNNAGYAIIADRIAPILEELIR